MDDLLDSINSQNHSDDQLDQVLETYQTYTERQSPTRQVNAHITYHVAQANQAMHQSFIDRGAKWRPCRLKCEGVVSTSPTLQTRSDLNKL